LHAIRLVCPTIGQAGCSVVVGIAGNVDKFSGPVPYLVDIPRVIHLPLYPLTRGGMEVFTVDTEIILTTSSAALLASATGPLFVEAEFTRSG
jgi:hypothetical protein